jgi:hypothetical protein
MQNKTLKLLKTLWEAEPLQRKQKWAVMARGADPQSRRNHVPVPR